MAEKLELKKDAKTGDVTITLNKIRVKNLDQWEKESV